MSYGTNDVEKKVNLGVGRVEKSCFRNFYQGWKFRDIVMKTESDDFQGRKWIGQSSIEVYLASALLTQPLL